MPSHNPPASPLPLVVGVEPDSVTRRLIALYLEPRGWEVQIAPDAGRLAAAPDWGRAVLCLFNGELLAGADDPLLARFQEKIGRVPVCLLLEPDGLPPSPRKHLVTKGVLCKPLRAEALLSLLESLHERAGNGARTENGNGTEKDTADGGKSGEPILKGLLNLIEEMGLDGELVLELTQSFLERGPVYIGDMQAALEAEDLRRLHIAAHTMKGMSGNLRFQELVDLNHQVCRQANAGNRVPLPGLLREIEADFSKIRSALQLRWPSEI